jgi:poly(3-hydroxybutyrate) depolymerase
MRRTIWVALITLASFSLVAPSAAPPVSAAVEKAFDDFWKAGNAGDAEKAAERLIKTGVDFDIAWSRLQAGRQYAPLKSGTQMLRLASADGTVIENAIEIPREYDAATRWPVRVQLHGGVMRRLPEGEEQNAPPRARRVNRIAGESAIYIQPRGFADAAWWHFNQVDNLLTVLDRVKRKYNVDENRVYVTGVSDGGTGVYFIAMKAVTPWSAFLPLNGNMRVLATPGTRADGQLYAGNFVNRPFFIVNGGQDPLYPVGAVTPHIVMMERAGTPVEFRPQPAAGHDTSWWPTERANFERFVRTHPRQPYPDRLSWETERADRYNRLNWLVIDRLGHAASNAALEDVNRFAPPQGGPDQPMFSRTKPSGRVDLTRTGNTLTVTSRGVAQFTLLLSPEVIDFAQPVTVIVNGRQVFHGPVSKDVGTLLKWAARDNDRTMLYGAELTLEVP